MIYRHQVLVNKRSSLTNEQTCVVTLKVSVKTCIVTNLREISEGETQVMYDMLEDLVFWVPVDVSFSCNELDHFPSRCKERFHQQLLETKEVDPDTSFYVVDKVVEFMVNSRRVDGDIDSGYVLDATLEILCFSLMGVCRVRNLAENREEAIKCSVCFENLKRGSMIGAFPCYHMFHWDCIYNWLERDPDCPTTCPNCRYCIDDATEDLLEDLLNLNDPIRRSPRT